MLTWAEISERKVLSQILVGKAGALAQKECFGRLVGYDRVVNNVGITEQFYVYHTEISFDHRPSKLLAAPYLAPVSDIEKTNYYS